MALPPELRLTLQATAAVANIIMNIIDIIRQPSALYGTREVNAANLSAVLCRCGDKLSKQSSQWQPLKDRDRSCELQGGSGGHRQGVSELQ